MVVADDSREGKGNQADSNLAVGASVPSAGPRSVST